MLQPNYELDDPIRGTWELRKGGGSNAGSQLGSRASHMSRASLHSVSPKKKISPDFHSQVSPIRKVLPRR